MTKTVQTEQVCPEVQVGDFFVSSWGYDQTNIDFYKVVSRTKATVKLQPWSSKVVSSDGYSDSVVPGSEPKVGMPSWTESGTERRVKPVLTKRLRAYSNRASVTINSYANAYHWQGTPAHQTGFGYGH